MRKLIAFAVVFAAASAANAKKPKQDETPPPPPAVTYEMDDQSMGEPLDQACLAAPFASETYDSEDNMIIVATADGGKAFLHLEGDCDINTLMFAASVSGGKNGCLTADDDITFSSNNGGEKTCKISAINNWVETPEDDFYKY